jgi:hypothetical protein
VQGNRCTEEKHADGNELRIGADVLGGFPVLAEFQQPRLFLVGGRGVVGRGNYGSNLTAEAALVLDALTATKTGRRGSAIAAHECVTVRGHNQ